MGFLSGLFRARDAPQNRTSGSAYSFFLGNMYPLMPNRMTVERTDKGQFFNTFIVAVACCL